MRTQTHSRVRTHTQVFDLQTGSHVDELLTNTLMRMHTHTQVFDLQTGSHVDELLVAEGDTVNGCDTHPFLSLLAVSTGKSILL